MLEKWTSFGPSNDKDTPQIWPCSHPVPTPTQCLRSLPQEYAKGRNEPDPQLPEQGIQDDSAPCGTVLPLGKKDEPEHGTEGEKDFAPQPEPNKEAYRLQLKP